MKILRFILKFFLIFLFAAILFFFGYYFFATKDAFLDPDKLLLRENNVILYDVENTPIKNVAALSNAATVRLCEIPKHAQEAFIATEDKRFYQHGGFDLKRIARAFLNNAKAKTFKEGASTISQQLIKNTHLTQEKTIKRKLREWKLTSALERKYSKNQILEKYLNTIYFGHNCFGISAAAQFYFDKTPSELSLSESAILAGLVKSPNNYSPFRNPERCTRRRDTVLTLMQKNGFIDETAYKNAVNAPLPTPSSHATDAGYARFVFDELTEIAEKTNFPSNGKIEIFTYLDQDLQDNLENIAKETDCDKILLVLDEKTHGFKGCVASVKNIRRLPASLIKPLLVYAPAIEENLLSPATAILDEKINYNGYAPENYGGKTYGYVSARECVEKSLNIPAVKVLQSLGVAKGVAYLEKLGLPLEKEDESLALALGGMKNGFTLKELLSAYSVFPSGKIQPCGFISKIKINGATVYEKGRTAKRVFGEDSAYLMTDMLRTTAKNGTAKKLRGLPFDIAAKTGTVGTSQGNTDAYALSFTSNDYVGVWLGNADNRFISHTGGGLPCSLLYKIHQRLYENYQQNGVCISSFQQPKNVREVKLDKPCYYDRHTIALADELSPAEYTFTELFKNSAIPLNKSTSFSFPTLLSPQIKLVNNQVQILFDKRSPTYYEYEIDRYDYVTHTTIYQGGYKPVVTDDCLQENKTYVYTVTPSYQGRKGAPITLPSVSTKTGDLLKDREILQKEWWDY